MTTQPSATYRIAPDERGTYLPAEIRLRLFQAGPDRTQVPLEIVDVAAEPADVLDLAVVQPAGADPTTLLRASLRADVLAQPDRLLALGERPIQLTLTVRPSGGGSAATAMLDGVAAIEVAPPPLVIHWSTSGQPDTRDQVLEVEAEEGTILSLDVWIQAPAGMQAPDAEFSHMANEDLAGRQLPPTKADFGIDPSSSPRLWVPGDARATTLWRVNRSLPSAERQDLVPPVDTAIRVRAWKKDAIEARGDETVSATSGWIAQGLVPVRIGPGPVQVELIDPKEPIPADGKPADLLLRVTRKRSGKPYAGPLVFSIVPNETRPVSTLTPDRLTVAPADDGQVRLAITPPELTYHSKVTYAEWIAVGCPASSGPIEIGRGQVWLAPSLHLDLVRKKRGLEFEPVTVDTLPSDRVSVLTGVVGIHVETTRDPVRACDDPVLVGNVDVVVPPDTEEKPTLTVVTGAKGAFRVALANLAPPAGDAGDATLDLSPDDLPPGDLAKEPRERIELYEQRVLPRIERAGRPLAQLVGTANSDALGSWRLELARQLAERPEDRLEYAIAAVELAEAAGVYADALATPYYDMWTTAGNVFGSLLSDLLSLLLTAQESGDWVVGKVPRPGVRKVIGFVDSWIVGPLLRTIRRGVVLFVEALEALLARLPGAALHFKEGLAAIQKLCNELLEVAGVEITGVEEIAEKAVDLVLKALLYVAGLTHAIVVQGLHAFPPWADSLVQHLGRHMDPAWAKIVDDGFKWIVDQVEILPTLGGVSVDAIKSILDPYPRLMTKAVDEVRTACTNQQIAPDAGPRREELSEFYGSATREAFTFQSTVAEVEEWLAIMNLVATLVQCLMVVYSAVRKLAEKLVETLLERLGKIDRASAGISAVCHAAEAVFALWSAWSLAGYGSEAVAGLKRT